MTLREKVGRNLREAARAVQAGPEARRALRRRYLFDALRRFVPVVGVEADDGFFFVPTYDRTVAKSLFVSGSWEPEHLRRAVELAGGPRGVFLDVGANLGTTSVAAARLGFERVVAFEPVASNYQLLRATVAANGLDHVISCVNAAVSDAPGEVRIEMSPLNSGAHSVGKSGEPVRAVTLDDSLVELGIEPRDIGMLWIDVEGHEAQVLRGAASLRDQQPPTVVEFMPEKLGAELPAMVDLLEGWSSLRDLRSGRRVNPGDLPTAYAGTMTDLIAMGA